MNLTDSIMLNIALFLMAVKKIDCSDRRVLPLQQSSDGTLIGRFESSCCKGEGTMILTYQLNNQNLLLETIIEQGEFYLPKKLS